MFSKVLNIYMTAKNPNSGRRCVKKHSVLVTVGIVVVLCLFGLCLIPNRKPSRGKTLPIPETTQSSAKIEIQTSPDFRKNTYVQEKPANQIANRPLSASQLVKRDNSNSGADGLPLGTTIRAHLANAVVSSDGNSPVIAVLTEDAQFAGAVVIPSGTKIYGRAVLDESSKRLQIRFHTVVFEDGSQSGISAIALQADGSSGLSGNYDSGNMKQQVGRFGGNFVSGLAAGMKERQNGGFSGPLEPGSLRNGLLNGLSEATSDQAKVFSQEMQKTRPFIQVPMGTGFVLYLEREFSP